MVPEMRPPTSSVRFAVVVIPDVSARALPTLGDAQLLGQATPPPVVNALSTKPAPTEAEFWVFRK
jgi:hypothetical protein